MNHQELSLFKIRLVSAIEAHLANGGKIVPKYFRFNDGTNDCRCPIGCLDINLGQTLTVAMTESMGFSVDNAEIWSFIWGFDGALPSSNNVPDLYNLGKELRAKYLREKE
jgi:hypothetical protein